jgi:hypothetical protein
MALTTAATTRGERIMKLVKELDDIIQKTSPGQIRNDLEFTRDKLIASLYDEKEEHDDSRHGQQKKAKSLCVLFSYYIFKAS